MRGAPKLGDKMTDRRMDTRAQIVRIIQEVSKKPVSVGDDESLFESDILDSFALTELVEALEREFSLKIPDSDLNPRKFDSIERIEQYLQNRK